MAEVIDGLGAAFGPAMAEVVAASRIWRNGDPAEPSDAVADGDELAVVPPVSGG